MAAVADEVMGAADDGGGGSSWYYHRGGGGAGHPTSAAPTPAHPNVGEDISTDWVDAAFGGTVEDSQAATPMKVLVRFCIIDET